MTAITSLRFFRTGRQTDRLPDQRPRWRRPPDHEPTGSLDFGANPRVRQLSCLVSARRFIAFVRKIADDFEVLTIRPDGKDISQLTHTRGNDAHVSWSPDGERLAFSSTRMGFKDEALNTNAPQPDGDIFIMRYDGTQVEQLTDNQWEEGGATWQPH